MQTHRAGLKVPDCHLIPQLRIPMTTYMVMLGDRGQWTLYPSTVMLYLPMSNIPLQIPRHAIPSCKEPIQCCGVFLIPGEVGLRTGLLYDRSPQIPTPLRITLVRCHDSLRRLCPPVPRFHGIHSAIPLLDLALEDELPRKHAAIDS